jgi:metacaspase-1
MAKGYSLHIGLNEVNPAVYSGKYKSLHNALNDSEFYYEMAQQRAFKCSTVLEDKNATSDNLSKYLDDFALSAICGDTIFISYSGHGTQVEDIDGDEGHTEEDNLDEALVLWDRLWIDDEFAVYWRKFKPGVRIFMITDSCFNGSVSRLFLNGRRGIPRGLNKLKMLNLKSFRSNYKTVKTLNSKNRDNPLCSIIHIAACKDDQVADDGEINDQNGVFTAQVKKIFNNGTFSGNYYNFFQAVENNSPIGQTPTWDLGAGKVDSSFINSIFLQL